MYLEMPIPASELIVNADGSVYHLGLRPQDLADIVLTVGDPDRVEMLSKYFDSIELKVRRREFVTHTGTYKGVRITAMSTGMGTDNIEIVMNELDALANIDLATRKPKDDIRKLTIIRLGTSGSLQTDVELDSHLASHTATGLDTLMFFYNLHQSAEETEICDAFQKAINLPFTPYQATADAGLLETIAFDMVPGNTLTCPGFYAPQGRELRLKTRFEGLIPAYNAFRHNNFRITNFEMETAGYYSMGRLLGHRMLSLNCIVAHRMSNKFSQQAEAVMDSLIRKVLDRVSA
ncbi:MAG: nucleoside phosphorylase [Bacteroidota bacterium]